MYYIFVPPSSKPYVTNVCVEYILLLIGKLVTSNVKLQQENHCFAYTTRTINCYSWTNVIKTVEKINKVTNKNRDETFN